MDSGALQSGSHPVAITQILEERAQNLERALQELDSELRRRFGETSFSVERSEQVLGAMQRLRWAIARSPVENPLSASANADDSSAT